MSLDNDDNDDRGMSDEALDQMSKSESDQGGCVVFGSVDLCVSCDAWASFLLFLLLSSNVNVNGPSHLKKCVL